MVLTDEQLMQQPRTIVSLVILHALISSRGDSSLLVEDMPGQAAIITNIFFATMCDQPKGE